MPDTITPTDIAVSRGQGTCTITWSDGEVQVLTLPGLRRQCPCAVCDDERKQRQANSLMVISGAEPTAELAGVEPVGGYALKFVWADGHNTGIYSYPYLRGLGG